MNYTVIGLFEDKKNTNQVKAKLRLADIDPKQVDISAYKAKGNVTDERYYDYDEDDNTTGFWSWLFGDDDDDRQRYSRVGSQSHVVTVYADSKLEAEKAARILDECGAIDVDERSQTYEQNFAGQQSKDATFKGRDETIKVVEEEMHVGKRTVETAGGVQIRSRIVEKPVKEELRLRKERVYVRRNPVNRPATEADLNTLKDKTIKITEHAEEAVVEKKARVVEEISVGKEVDIEQETVSGTVRKTVVDIDETHDKTHNKKRHDRK